MASLLAGDQQGLGLSVDSFAPPQPNFAAPSSRGGTPAAPRMDASPVAVKGSDPKSVMAAIVGLIVLLVVAYLALTPIDVSD